MTEHYASVTITAPVHQVYTLFTHFDDFPKFMHFVKEVTYYDNQRTHWVAHVLRDYEWDAINEDWIPDQQIGWRSTSGLKNTGKVKFRALGPNRTMVDVYISYTPPTGTIGVLGDTFGGGEYFAAVLREDLNHFAHMVEQAPPDAFDPMSSYYLFHSASAVTSGNVTERQKVAMANDPRMRSDVMAQREVRLKNEEMLRQQTLQAQEIARRRKAELEQRARLEQQAFLAQETARRLLERRAQAEILAHEAATRQPPDPVYDTLGGRNASKDRTAAGDRDGSRKRFPGYEQDPMLARYPLKDRKTMKLSEEELEKFESPWLHSIRGDAAPPPIE